MRAFLLASGLALIPAAAWCQPTCAVATPARQGAQQPARAIDEPRVTPAESAAIVAPLIGADRIGRVPALRRIASGGAKLFDLGIQHGLSTVFASNGVTFQVFYLAPDGQAEIGGVMWDAAGHNVTRDQVSEIEGAIPTVEIGGPDRAASEQAGAAEASPGKLLAMMEKAVFGTVGPVSAPRLYMVIDPLCSFSVRAMDQLRPYVAAGKLQLAVIPVSILDHEDNGQSTRAAKSLLGLPRDQMVEAWRNQLITPLPQATPDTDERLARNMAAAQALGLQGTPTFVWRKAGGEVGRATGLPGNIDALLASMGG